MTATNTPAYYGANLLRPLKRLLKPAPTTNSIKTFLSKSC